MLGQFRNHKIVVLRGGQNIGSILGTLKHIARPKMYSRAKKTVN